jgi:hypothetical protein
VCSLVLTRVSSVRNFDSITSLLSNHTPDIGVTENNEITLSKLRTEGTLVKNQICMQRLSFSGYLIISERVTHRFTKVTSTLYNFMT